jgi:acyl-CoA thioester hydrolase
MMMHIDHETRRASPWREETMRRLEAMATTHRALPKPEKAGRIIAIPRR